MACSKREIELQERMDTTDTGYKTFWTSAGMLNPKALPHMFDMLPPFLPHPVKRGGHLIKKAGGTLFYPNGGGR